MSESVDEPGSQRSLVGRSADDDWSSLCQTDAALAAIDSQSGGALTEFAAVTASSPAPSASHYGALRERLDLFFRRSRAPSVLDVYVDKVARLYEERGGKEEKMLAHPPLGWLLENPQHDPSDWDAPAEMMDPDGLVKPRSEDARRRAVHRLLKRKKDVLEHNKTPPDTDSDDDDDPENIFSDFHTLDVQASKERAKQAETEARRARATGQTDELGETRDRLEYATRKLWKVKRYLAAELIVKYRFFVLVSSLVTFVLSVTLFAFGAQQLDGGRMPVFFACALGGIVGLLSSFLGAFGALPAFPNERILHLFFSSQVWMVSLLTVFFFIEVNYIREYEDRCSPSLMSYVSKDSCSRRPELFATLIVGFILLFSVFAGTYCTSQLLDVANDEDSLQTRYLLFRYRLNLYKELQLPLIQRGVWNPRKQLVVGNVPTTPAPPPHPASAPDLVSQTEPSLAP